MRQRIDFTQIPDEAIRLDVAIEGRHHRHQAGALVVEHLGEGQVGVLGMPQRLPQGPAPRQQPEVELGERTEALVGGLLPQPPPAVLHVLLDDTLLPAAGDVAEVGVEQVVRGQRGKAGVHRPRFALVDLVHRGLHVVVDAAAGDAAQRGERPRVGVEQHLVALRRVGLHHECPARAQLQVRRQDLPPDPADHQPLFAPVELECFAQLESQRNVGFDLGLPTLRPPAPDELGDPAVVAAKARRLQLAEQLQRRAPVPRRASRIGFQRLGQLRRERRQLGVRRRSPPVLRLRPLRRLQPPPHRLARQPGAALDLRQRQPVPKVHAADYSQILHGDHLL